MFKITFIGAGSTVFAKNVLGDIMVSNAFDNFEIALYDIDTNRLEESYLMLENIKAKYKSTAKIVKYTNRKDSLRDAKYIVNAVQVGGYKPSTVIDFEVPKKFGLRQTIADTLGIGGIFRTLRTAPVLKEFADDIHEVCPNALFLNYVNPMAMLTNYLIKDLQLNAVGLCHSVQVCAKMLLESVGMEDYIKDARWNIAGINHQSWLLDIKDKQGNDLYPLIKERSKSGKYDKTMQNDLVRHYLMHTFGYYNTESSEHTAEYSPYFIKAKYPELIDRFNIPLDEYPRRCVNQITDWNTRRDELVNNKDIEHTRSHEYASFIIEAIEKDKPYVLHGNVLNKNLITNLPYDCCVEVACVADGRGITPNYVGKLPEQLAALNRTNVNVQLLTLEALRTLKKEDIYHAALLDPHTSSELSIDDIIAMCDELIEAHGTWIPKFN